MTASIASFLPAGLAFIMFALGLKLSIDDFRRVLSQPVAVGLGLLAQVVLLPLTALGLIAAFDLSPEASVGLMILAACPGGVSAAMITNLSRGDTCLSITLTAFTSALSFITVPIIVGFSLAHFLGQSTGVDYPVGQGMGGLFLITLLPVAAGLLLSHKGWVSNSASSLLGRVATAVFALIVISTFVTQWSSIVENFPLLGPAILLLNLLTMTTGAVIGCVGRLPADGRIALAVECGIQNSALGITIAVSMLGMAQLAVPSVVYAFLMNVTAVLLIAARQLRRPAAA
ncbi:MAG: bile acid:sodium symporter family protein [Woeseiaceae bacterium]|nr:bile acid:sodium symporter family protein [Woeseiaceae bacterium]